MIVLGIDTGPTTCGWARLMTHPGLSRPAFLNGGTVGSAQAALLALIEHCDKESLMRGEDFVVAIENVSGYAHEHKRSSALNATAHIAGLIEGLAAAKLVKTELIPASVWRRHLCGNGSASDATVARALKILVLGLPERTNVHVRDAVGAAFAVIQRRPQTVALSMGV